MSSFRQKQSLSLPERFPGRSGILGWLWITVMLFLLQCQSGCKSMTEAKLEQLRLEIENRHLEIEKQEKAQTEAEEKSNKELGVRRERQEKLRIAEDKLASGDAKSALSAVEELLAPTLATRKDPTTGKVEAVVQTPADMSSAEHSILLSFQGATLAELHRLDESQASYRESLKLDPSNRHARRNLGRLLFEAKQFKLALQVWQPELSDGRRDAELLSLVGRARHEIGKMEGNPAELEAARVALEQVLVETPEDLETVRLLADLSYQSGTYAAAQRYYDLVRRQSPLGGEELEKLGYCAQFLGDRRKALDYLELAAGAKLPTKELCTAISNLCVEFHFPSRAAEWLALAHGNDPAAAPPEVRLQVATLFVESWRGEEALTWLAAIGSSDPSHEAAQALLVKVHAAAGRADECIAAYEKVKRMSALDASIHLRAGYFYLQKRSYDSAVAAYSKASGTLKFKADGLVGLADVALAKGDPEAALKYYREALEHRPGDTSLQSAISQIQDELGSAQSGQGLPFSAVPANTRGSER